MLTVPFPLERSNHDDDDDDTVMTLAISICPYFVPSTILSSWHIIIHLNHPTTLKENIINTPIFG